MADKQHHNTPPVHTSKWLLEAARKRSGAPTTPSKALLDMIQRAHHHPHQVARKLRDDALKARRDPDALANWMAEISKTTPQARLVQRPREAPAGAALESIESTSTETVPGKTGAAVESSKPTPTAVFPDKTEAAVESSESIPTAVESIKSTPTAVESIKSTPTAVESINSTPIPVIPDKTGAAVGTAELSEDGEVTDTADTPAVITRLAASASRSATPSTALTSPRPPRRVGAKGQVTKPTLAKKRHDQTDRKNRVVRKKSTKPNTPSSASGTASPMEIDSPPSMSESGPPTTHPDAQSYSFSARPSMPAWYLSVTKQSQDLLERKRPQELAAIDALKACIGRCEHERSKAKLDKEYSDLRDHVHKAESSLNMDKVKVKKTRILTAAGLPRIFNEHTKFPWDLKADAWHLYERWMNEDFDRDILRGIVTVKGKDRNGDRLNSAYRAQHPRDPKNFGHNGAVLGQWWPSQLCAVRDGIHGAAQGGIYGDKDQGVYSLILSSGGYHDKDYGDTIEYSGTDGSNFNMTAATHSMITSAKLGNHIRVLRSSQLPKTNKHRPEVGLRYDGLYQIKSYQENDLEKQTYLFHLERIPGQEPIRSQGVTARPTVFEKQEYDRCKGRI